MEMFLWFWVLYGWVMKHNGDNKYGGEGAQRDSGQWPMADSLHQGWQTIVGQDPVHPPSGASGHRQ